MINNKCYNCTDMLCICSADDLDACLACRDPANYYLRDAQRCVTDCSNDQFYDSELESCEDCHPYCDECLGGTKYQCDVCSDLGFEVGNTFCNNYVCTDPLELFNGTTVNPICIVCTNPCATC